MKIDVNYYRRDSPWGATMVSVEIPRFVSTKLIEFASEIAKAWLGYLTSMQIGYLDGDDEVIMDYINTILNIYEKKVINGFKHLFKGKIDYYNGTSMRFFIGDYMVDFLSNGIVSSIWITDRYSNEDWTVFIDWPLEDAIVVLYYMVKKICGFDYTN